MLLHEILKAFVLGVVQGVTEWLPVSSTGHLILLDEILRLDVSADFMELFRVVIQFGSIAAVLLLYGKRLDPWHAGKSPAERRICLSLWGRILLASLPAAAVGFLADDWLDEHFYHPVPVAVMLALIGAALIVAEKHPPHGQPICTAAEDVGIGSALVIGCFQVLSLLPGTSRSGSTILGGLTAGLSRTAAAEFSFFLAIPVMAGASLLKTVKFLVGSGFAFSSSELLLLLVGTVTAFLVSVLVIRFLLDLIRRRSFAGFGWYRIALAVVVLAVTLVNP